MSASDPRPEPHRSPTTKSPHRAALAQRARDYLAANLDGAFSMRHLSESTRCSERVLQYAFREIYGMAPQACFQAMKLDQTHRELRAHGPRDVRVTDVALRWGFTHFGRFSLQYRRRFGESPSQTLRRKTTDGRACEMNSGRPM